MKISLGCETLFDSLYRCLWQGKRLGLVTNFTGIDRHFRRTVDQLLANGAMVVKLFTAEHGFYGAAQAGAQIHTENDRKTGIEVISLYGKRKEMTREMLDGIEVLLFEFQDLGVRFFTYLSTLFRVMEAVGEAEIPLLILDRPNPLGGENIEGAGIEEACLSFVGTYNIPIRHGMTLGELASLYREETSLKIDLHVIPMLGWCRSGLFPNTKLPWIPPSPNMPTFTSAQLYPGTCFLEGTNLSEGRGSTLPFQWIGAPWLKSEEVAEHLNQLQLPGIYFRPISFTPTFSKYAGEKVEGVQIHIIDETKLMPTSLGLILITTIKKLYPAYFAWLPSIRGRYFIDLLWGSPRYRLEIEQGRNVGEIIQEWQEDATTFYHRRKSYLLY